MCCCSQIAKESLVLLKNDPIDDGQPALPLRPSQKVFLTGPHSNSRRLLCGGWTLHCQCHFRTSCAFFRLPFTSRCFVFECQNVRMNDRRARPCGRFGDRVSSPARNCIRGADTTSFVVNDACIRQCKRRRNDAAWARARARLCRICHRHTRCRRRWDGAAVTHAMDPSRVSTSSSVV